MPTYQTRMFRYTVPGLTTVVNTVTVTERCDALIKGLIITTEKNGLEMALTWNIEQVSGDQGICLGYTFPNVTFLDWHLWTGPLYIPMETCVVQHGRTSIITLNNSNAADCVVQICVLCEALELNL